MGGGSSRARIKPLRRAPIARSTAAAGSLPPTPRFRHSYAPSVIPAQAGTHHPPPTPPPFPIHPSPLPGGRLGGGWNAASAHEVIAVGSGRPLNRRRRLAASNPPLPSFLRSLRHSCAGRNPPPTTHTTPLPQFIPPPSQGEVRWGVEARERARGRCDGPRSPTQPPPQARCLQPPAAVIPAQAGTTRPPPTPSPSPIHPSPLPGGRLGGG